MNIIFIHGANSKPAASRLLEETLSQIDFLSGECFFGFPLIATPEGSFSVDATFVSPQIGIVVFDLIEGDTLGDYVQRQDDLSNKIESKLRLHRELMERRQLKVPVRTVSFAPAVSVVDNEQESEYSVATALNLPDVMRSLLMLTPLSEQTYKSVLSAIESLSAIRRPRPLREVQREDSRGAILNRLEQSIGTLDYRQNRAVIETVDGVQRIRGLAGSGKSIVIALKAAYLHAQYPDWKIAVTFHTRSLKQFYEKLITRFCISQTGLEPDWEKVKIINAWGARLGTGVYSEFCQKTGCKFYGYDEARKEFGAGREFAGACQKAIEHTNVFPKLYDVILVDEAQDLPPEFLRLCYLITGNSKRLIYAYDELQNLEGTSVPEPEVIFGTTEEGKPVVEFTEENQDIILSVCYRNSRPVLVTAHALGFGIYRQSSSAQEPGIVQMFEYAKLWQEVGYSVQEGILAPNHYVSLERTDESSPKFLEAHSPIDDIVYAKVFETEDEQINWLVEQIQQNIHVDELLPEDILVVHPIPMWARSKLEVVRNKLSQADIKAHIAGSDTHQDVFFVQGSVALSHIYRAKGNETGMVYVINAELCEGHNIDLLGSRNGLFTAITRSKAWVRILGVGQPMQKICEEIKKIKENNFRLRFQYPSIEQMKQLNLIRYNFSRQSTHYPGAAEVFEQLIREIDAGRIDIDTVDEETRQKLIQLLNQRSGQHSHKEE